MIYFHNKLPDPLHAVFIDQLRRDPATAAGDVELLATLAAIIYSQMDRYPPSVDVAVALACQHLADVRAELTEGGFRGSG